MLVVFNTTFKPNTKIVYLSESLNDNAIMTIDEELMCAFLLHFMCEIETIP